MPRWICIRGRLRMWLQYGNSTDHGLPFCRRRDIQSYAGCIRTQTAAAWTISVLAPVGGALLGLSTSDESVAKARWGHLKVRGRPECCISPSVQASSIADRQRASPIAQG